MKNSAIPKIKFSTDKLIAIGISFLALLPLFRFGWGNSPDWHNHLWSITYYGEYFLRNFKFPLFLNMSEVIGDPQPLFYGGFFYKILGLASIIFGAGLSVRILFWFFLTLQYSLIHRLIYFLTKNKLVSHVVSILWTFSIYPLTNLYSRSALTEFFAGVSLVCAISCYLLLVLDFKGYVKTYVPWGVGFFFFLAATSHPITYLLGGVTFILIFLGTLSLCTEKAKLIKILLINGALVIAGTLPWIYVTKIFSPYLNVSLNAIDTSTEYLWDWWIRLYPLPFDLRTYLGGTGIPSRFLELQINTLLLALTVFCGALIFREKIYRQATKTWGLLLVGIIITKISFLMTVSLKFWDLFVPKIFYSMQMNYRMINYINIGILLILVALFLMGGKKLNFQTEKMKIFFTVLLTISGIGLFQKWTSTFIVVSTREAKYTLPFHDKREVIHLPPSFYFPTGYATPSLFKKREILAQDMASGASLSGGNLTKSMEARFQPSDKVEFGQVKPLQIMTDGPTFVKTNVLPFLWNNILVRDESADPALSMSQTQNSTQGKAPVELLVKDGFLGFSLPTAGHFKISYVAKVDLAFEILDWISSFVFYFWAFFMGFICLKRRIALSEVFDNGRRN